MIKSNGRHSLTMLNPDQSLHMIQVEEYKNGSEITRGFVRSNDTESESKAYSFRSWETVNQPRKKWTSRPQRVFCRKCQSNVKTLIIKSVTRNQKYYALSIAICCLPLVFLPFVFPQCYECAHQCPECSQILGIYNVN
ncbi:UNKNOWN [Stylonychia lemnae]|uniref:LITAF domain-containing protein n=1 Tax=Stylonychia lemnae TaxID=5949 RepID=A0A077ZYY3_STYLE|nr:UNKNOWN [Stylonychia lemnae]|eukprot:CDW74378.1 UNKNOWN [Stylonychia lemnae]